MVNSCADAIAVVRETDLTAAVPRGYVDNRTLTRRLEIAALPFDNEKLLYKLAWSSGERGRRRRDGNAESKPAANTVSRRMGRNDD